LGKNGKRKKYLFADKKMKKMKKNEKKRKKNEKIIFL
jgi:hypothetical protein